MTQNNTWQTLINAIIDRESFLEQVGKSLQEIEATTGCTIPRLIQWKQHHYKLGSFTCQGLAFICGSGLRQRLWAPALQANPHLEELATFFRPVVPYTQRDRMLPPIRPIRKTNGLRERDQELRRTIIERMYLTSTRVLSNEGCLLVC